MFDFAVTMTDVMDQLNAFFGIEAVNPILALVLAMGLIVLIVGVLKDIAHPS